MARSAKIVGADNAVSLKIINAEVDPFEHRNYGIDLPAVEYRHARANGAQIVLGLMQHFL